MRQTNSFEIERKRFTKADVVAMGTALMDEAAAARQAGRRCLFEVKLSCADGTAYSAEDLDVFVDGGEADSKRPESVTIELSDYKNEKLQTVRLSLKHGWKGTLVVSGEDANWVRGWFTRLYERVESAAPSDRWFARGTLRLHLLFSYLLALAAFLTAVFVVGLLQGIGVLDERTGTALRVLVGYGGAIAAAAFGGRAADYLESAWPSIDLDFGPSHLNLARRRREKAGAVILVVVIPVLLGLVQWLLFPRIFPSPVS